MIKVGRTERDLYGEERFGPISFVIACDDARDALAQATNDAKAFLPAIAAQVSATLGADYAALVAPAGC